MPPGIEIEVRTYALRQLSRREQSAHQLREKLSRRFPDADGSTLDETIRDLAARKYLDDRRFAGQLVSRNCERGKPWLEAKLKECGVDDVVSGDVLGTIVWPTLAEATADRMERWGFCPPLGLKDAVRLSRALARLGYDIEEIRHELERLT
jgi:SOS response regulatory protein OraA/RecX